MKKSMEATELRIGNLVQWSDETQIVPITITRLGNFSVGMESIKPIPLTEEWLLNFGFEKYHSNMFVKEGRLTVNWYLLHEYYFISFNHKRVELKYVHQLQNLYYSLTGTELSLAQNKTETNNSI
jgi:hypothetical protein